LKAYPAHFLMRKDNFYPFAGCKSEATFVQLKNKQFN